MENNKQKIFIFSIAIIIVVGIVGAIITSGKSSVPIVGKYDDLAMCIEKSGAKFYGAFWCPHCQAQKKAFGSSAKLLPYIECSTPDGNSQNQVCKDAGIKSYPTWRFPNGEELTGDIPLPDLAQKTNCTLPQ